MYWYEETQLVEMVRLALSVEWYILFFLQFDQRSCCRVFRVVKKGTHVWVRQHSASREGGVGSKYGNTASVWKNDISCYFLGFDQSSGCRVSRVVKKGTHVWGWRDSSRREGGVRSKLETMCICGRMIYIVFSLVRPELRLPRILRSEKGDTCMVMKQLS